MIAAAWFFALLTGAVLGPFATEADCVEYRRVAWPEGASRCWRAAAAVPLVEEPRVTAPAGPRP